MAEIPYRVTEILKRFLKELKKNDIPVENAILFGSYANGSFNEWSDIDVVVVSGAFKSDRFLDRNMMRRIKLEISCDLEPLPYCPEDFTMEDPFIKRVVETGVSLI